MAKIGMPMWHRRRCLRPSRSSPGRSPPPSSWQGKADYIGLGVIARFFPADKVHEVLKQAKRASVRERDLPAHVVAYYVIALAWRIPMQEPLTDAIR